jgi:hypothetical protein
MDLPPMAQLLLTLAGGLGLTGMIGPWVVRQFRRGARAELEDSLESKFATRESLTGLRRALLKEQQDLRTLCEATRSMAEIATHNADTALDKVREVEMKITHQWERITERMQSTAETLERVANKVEKMALEQAKLEERSRGERK